MGLDLTVGILMPGSDLANNRLRFERDYELFDLIRTFLVRPIIVHWYMDEGLSEIKQIPMAIR